MLFFIIRGNIKQVKEKKHGHRPKKIQNKEFLETKYRNGQLLSIIAIGISH